MASTQSPRTPSPVPSDPIALDSDSDDNSQRSISLSSPPQSRRNSVTSDPDPRQSFATQSSDSYSGRQSRTFSHAGTDVRHSSSSHARQTSIEIPFALGHAEVIKPVTYPPSPNRDDVSVVSFASTSSRKARPESLIIAPTSEPLILGVALVDFNHLVGPRIEYHKGEIFEDEEVAKILPFLALPDGAHLSNEDYSYFHLVKPGPNPTTIFGISCNQQISAASLLVKAQDVTRSTVQKAVVVLASKPVFGPIREKLRVVTTALFLQRDFTDASILDDFGASLELSLRAQLTESALYMGTSLRELVHTFRQRTLVLVKALLLQKRIMFFGYPVEKLCTFQYSLVSLLPGMLQTLEDCGSPPLASRAPTLSRPTSLRTSDHKSMMAFMGLPLDIFGKDAFFQPYLPLQQLDIAKSTPSWLCGCTNTIITHQSEIDLLVNTETGILEFRDPMLERSVGLTPADRKWMDDIMHDVNEAMENSDPLKPSGMHKFKGSDDYLRSKFEEYISAALSCVKYRDFLDKGSSNGVLITGGTGANPSAVDDFNALWISEFRSTKAYEVWDRITDPVIFDLVEPRHPCTEKPSVVTDIGLRLQEGIQDLKLEQQLAPAREAVSRTLAAGSTGFFKAVEGVRGRWAARTANPPASGSTSPPMNTSEGPVPIDVSHAQGSVEDPLKTAIPPQSQSGNRTSGLRSFSLNPNTLASGGDVQQTPGSTAPTPTTATVSSWGSGIGSFFATAKSTTATRFSLIKTATTTPGSPSTITPVPPSAPTSASGSVPGTPTRSLHSLSDAGGVASVGPTRVGS